jgi:hypothetical protein
MQITFLKYNKQKPVFSQLCNKIVIKGFGAVHKNVEIGVKD